jgi:hypothetical protein
VPLALLYLGSRSIGRAPRRRTTSSTTSTRTEAYFGLFLFGFLLARSDALWTAIRRWWRVAAVLAVAATASSRGDRVWMTTERSRCGARSCSPCARDVQGWNAIVALIGLADRYWNRDHRGARRSTRRCSRST